MNWGYKILLGLGLFMGFISVLVGLMIANNDKDTLIENNYYENGLSYDLDYDARKNAARDKMIPRVSRGAESIEIAFPQPVSYTILLRMLADSEMDTSFTGKVMEKEVIIPAAGLNSGSWLLRIEYKTGTNNYLYQEKIQLP